MCVYVSYKCPPHLQNKVKDNLPALQLHIFLLHAFTDTQPRATTLRRSAGVISVAPTSVPNSQVL